MTTQTSYTQKAWTLDDLFRDRKQATRHSRESMTGIEFESHLGELSPISAQRLLSRVRQFETITAACTGIQLRRAGVFPDTQDQAHRHLLQGRSVQRRTDTVSSFAPVWKRWTRPQRGPPVDVWEITYWLETLRLFKPHTLTEAEEKIINIKDTTGVSALQTLYDLITNRYTFTIEIDGEPKSLTRDALMTYAYHPDGDLRAKAYQELYRVSEMTGRSLDSVPDAGTRQAK